MDPAQCALLVMQDEPHYREGATFRSEMNFGYFIDVVARHLRKATLAVPTTTAGAPFGQVLNLEHAQFTELPYWHSLISYVRLSRTAKADLRARASELVAAHDALLVRLPSLPAAVFAAEAHRLGRPVIAYLAGNILSAANPLRSGNPLVRVAAGAMARYVHHRTMRLVRHAQAVFVMGRELYLLAAARNPATQELIESLTSERELFVRADTLPAAGPVVLFRAARLNPNKGTEYLLDAVAALVQRGYDVRLRLAGGGNEPAYVAGLQEQSGRLGIAERVEWLGQVPFGPQMQTLYRESHIAVLSSLSEGFPRFITEAWAYSVPVVTTRLPSLCPPVVADENAVLADPASGASLAEALARVIDDAPLRQRIIARGLELARESTIERQSRRVADVTAAVVAAARGNMR